MIIIDDFCQDDEMLEFLSSKTTWENLESIGSWYTFEGFSNSKLDEFIFYYIVPAVGNKVVFDYVEAWCNILDEYSSLDWHQDKNEEKAAKKGEIITPEAGIVYYPMPTNIWGGYLEIQHINPVGAADYERIEPKHNRLVFFDPSKLHRVSKILAGTRYGLQINFWKGQPEEK